MTVTVRDMSFMFTVPDNSCFFICFKFHLLLTYYKFKVLTCYALPKSAVQFESNKGLCSALGGRNFLITLLVFTGAVRSLSARRTSCVMTPTVTEFSDMTSPGAVATALDTPHSLGIISE